MGLARGGALRGGVPLEWEARRAGNDESGTANAIIPLQLFQCDRLVIHFEPALIVTGHLQNEQGVIHVMAEETSLCLR